ncbi:unnamed protein product [Pseudo-nitzschia multistriata]|uniref:(S)-ureidoglycine aminohydrolase cupin domain-containing protein n=1 Tax=Pseudo-nitzschia multistriata TaxID=183589 RepID=A0A448YV56_9STRA|nr:unnamed protein product [Pseudo-nitzschia multistriata]
MISARVYRASLSVLVILIGSSFYGNGKGTGIAMTCVESFAPLAKQGRRSGARTEFQKPGPSWLPQSLASSSPSSLAASPPRTELSVPSQAQCESLGIREWPQQSKSGSWTEAVAPGNSLVRYVLEGSGSLEIVTDGETERQSVRPGTLVEIESSESSGVQLEWACDASCPEMVLLTPGFEEGGVFLGVLAGILVLFGVLLSGALG